MRPRRCALLISAMPSEPSARMMTSRSGGCTCAGSSAFVVMVLPCGRPARANAANSATAASAHAHHGANTTMAATAAVSAGQAQRQDRAARLAGLPALLVQPQVIVQQPVRGGLALQLRSCRGCATSEIRRPAVTNTPQTANPAALAKYAGDRTPW